MTDQGSLLKVYIAGKVSKESNFGTHHWREEFVKVLQEQSGRELISIDPTRSGAAQNSPEVVFGADAYMIAECDVFIVYLSDDISVGGSQEILIAKYFKKPVIGFAPRGGKFNGSTKELFGVTIEDYKDPFVFSTCDIVTGTIEETAAALQKVGSFEPKSLQIIPDLLKRFKDEELEGNTYLKDIIS